MKRLYQWEKAEKTFEALFKASHITAFSCDNSLSIFPEATMFSAYFLSY